MIRNISISAFINTIFILALIAIGITFTVFIKLDKQRYIITTQKKHELVAENILKTLETKPTISGLKIFIDQFKINLVENDQEKLNIINNGKQLLLRETNNGMYRIFNFDDILKMSKGINTILL
jgi:two-component system OmpR family sensor kinase